MPSMTDIPRHFTNRRDMLEILLTLISSPPVTYILKYFNLPMSLYSELNLTDIDNQAVIPIHVYSFMKTCRVL